MVILTILYVLADDEINDEPDIFETVMTSLGLFVMKTYVDLRLKMGAYF